MKKRILAASALLAAAPIAAVAETETTTFDVNAEVVASCSVSADSLAFGNYDPLSVGAHNGDTTVSVTCSDGASYDIGLNDGLNAEAGQRRMTDGGTNHLDYDLFRDTERLDPWGDTVGTDTVADTGTGAAQAHTVYASIPEQSNATIGTYSDTVTVTVTY